MPGVTTPKAKDGRARMNHGVHIKRNKKGDFYAVVVAKNGHILFKSSECYVQKQSLKKALVACVGALSGPVHDHTVVKKKA
jgi:uncharacterized protein YegP (UPF0339 family)